MIGGQMESGEGERKDSKRQDQRDRDGKTTQPPLSALDLAQARQSGFSVIHELILFRHEGAACSIS